MSEKRKVEVFSAGCAVCDDAIAKVRDWACESCDVVVLDMTDDKIAAYARELGVRSVPAVAIDGALADCCTGGGVDADVLRAAGLGQPMG